MPIKFSALVFTVSRLAQANFFLAARLAAAVIPSDSWCDFVLSLTLKLKMGFSSWQICSKLLFFLSLAGSLSAIICLDWSPDSFSSSLSFPRRREPWSETDCYGGLVSRNAEVRSIKKSLSEFSFKCFDIQIEIEKEVYRQEYSNWGLLIPKVNRANCTTITTCQGAAVLTQCYRIRET